MKFAALSRIYQDYLVEPLGPQRARRTVIVSLGIVVFYLLIIPSLMLSEAAKGEGRTLRSKQQEFQRLAAELRSLKTAVDGFEQRSPVPAGTATQTVSDLLNLPGTKARTKSIKSLGTKEAGDRQKEENIEVQIEKLTLNELINICYRIEQTPGRIVLKSAQIKRSFESPELLEATLMLSLFVQASQAR
jgi:hypothetical protein